MSDWATIEDLKQYLDQVTDPAQDPVLQAVLDRAEQLIRRKLSGVVVEVPAPDDLVQIELEVASSLYLTRGTASLLETAGAAGQGDFRYIGYLSDQQTAALAQIRIDLRGLAV